jgi:hypothetical protein
MTSVNELYEYCPIVMEKSLCFYVWCCSFAFLECI